MSNGKPPTLSGEVAAGVRQALGTIPEDLLGIAVGDWLKEKRRLNQDRLAENTKRILDERHVESDQESASPKLFIAICKAAIDDDAPEIQELWARLLAAAVDTARASNVRINFVQIVKELEPIDAMVLRNLYGQKPSVSRNQRNDISDLLKVSGDQVEVSFLNLARLNLVAASLGGPIEAGQVHLTSTGRELLRILY